MVDSNGIAIYHPHLESLSDEARMQLFLDYARETVMDGYVISTQEVFGGRLLLSIEKPDTKKRLSTDEINVIVKMVQEDKAENTVYSAEQLADLTRHVVKDVDSDGRASLELQEPKRFAATSAISTLIPSLNSLSYQECQQLFYDFKPKIEKLGYTAHVNGLHPHDGIGVVLVVTKPKVETT
jgi:hypothetical protein